MKPAAAYLRVSTTKQETENQRADMKATAKQLGYSIMEWRAEKVTGRTLKRPALDQLRKDAKDRKVTTIITWSLDRLSRAGVLDSLLLMREFEHLGVEVISCKDPIPPPGSPHRDLVLPVLFWIAEMESKRRSERVKAALVVARAKGHRLGRKPREVDVARVRTMRKAGRSWRSIAKAIKVPKATIMRAVERSTMG